MPKHPTSIVGDGLARHLNRYAAAHPLEQVFELALVQYATPPTCRPGSTEWRPIW